MNKTPIVSFGVVMWAPYSENIFILNFGIV